MLRTYLVIKPIVNSTIVKFGIINFIRMYKWIYLNKILIQNYKLFNTNKIKTINKMQLKIEKIKKGAIHKKKNSVKE